MSNITKLPKDTVQLAQLRMLLRAAKAEIRILTTENRKLKIKNAKMNKEIVKLNEKAALVPTLQKEVKRLTEELEKCRQSKHGGDFPIVQGYGVLDPIVGI